MFRFFFVYVSLDLDFCESAVMQLQCSLTVGDKS